MNFVRPINPVPPTNPAVIAIAKPIVPVKIKATPDLPAGARVTTIPAGMVNKLAGLQEVRTTPGKTGTSSYRTPNSIMLEINVRLLLSGLNPGLYKITKEGLPTKVLRVVGGIDPVRDTMLVFLFPTFYQSNA